MNTSGGLDEKSKLSYSDITKAFDNYLIQYLKFTTDWYIYVSKKSAITLGLYLSYDFGMNYSITYSGEFEDRTPFTRTDEFSYSAVNLGFSIGYYFGRANNHKK